jgi:hypothetical protein
MTSDQFQRKFDSSTNELIAGMADEIKRLRQRAEAAEAKLTSALTHLGAIDRKFSENNYESLLKGDLLLLMGGIENLAGQAAHGDRWQSELQRRQNSRR